MPHQPPFDELWRAIWRSFADAVREPTHAFRTPVLATIAGTTADARMVVLREASTPRLTFFTDARSPKAAQIDVAPRGTLVFWDAARRWQIRARATLSVLRRGARVEAAWARVRATPRASDYLAAQAPGTRLAGEPSPTPVTDGALAVVDAVVEELDWLELGASAHRRAVLTASEGWWVEP